MKTNELIEALRSELYSDKYCISDFLKWDVPAIKASGEPFFWLVNTNGTHLVFCGTTRINEVLGTEAGRMRVFRDPHAPIAAITYYKDSAYPTKVFYWDGFNLQRVTIDEVCMIWDNLSERLIQRAMSEYPEEYAQRDALLPVRFASPETEERYKKSLEYSDDLADESLARCVERLTKYPRCAINQYILISTDFVEHGYDFAEMVNDKCAINGGIIPSFKKGYERWQIHT